MHRLSVAPMMDRTDRHCRFFHRLLSRHTRLYTEMLTAGAVIHGDRDRLLGFDPAEHPVALQLGGSEPAMLAQAARIGERFGYDEVNLNCGCPSDRVKKGRFGASLMAEPELVGRCLAAMREAVSVPVTVKCRVGIDDQDDGALARFVETVHAFSGVAVFIVHARKAWLKGLSPKQNREVPPLRYELVLRLKAERPDLCVVLNGGVPGLDEAEALLEDGSVDGVMLGRAAYSDPWLLADADRRLFGAQNPVEARQEAVDALLPYAERLTAEGIRLHALARHLHGLFQGCPGARAFRRHLAENAHLPGAGPEVLAAAASLAAPPDRLAA
ncbi:MAG: tRNA dihydrouridine(20/20a) synthase DusA [Alphaproteobacteria bacterium]|nr:tRNA dihydrouridine(20/20a) synthase DusA [Alphaproteobacteria bacterium]